MRLRCLILAPIIVLVPALAGAQPAPEASAPGIYTFPNPPAGFDPLTASQADLATYGLPPRPSPLGRSATAYAIWARIMKAAKHHVMPQIRMTDRRHGPAILRAGIQHASAQTSLNWSGQVLTSGSTSFGSSAFAEVTAQWVISAVQEPVGSCSGTDVSAIWVGIDGLNSSDVLQAGTEGDTACSNGVTTQNYYPWFEWYPNYSYEVQNFIEFRGATVYVVVHATSATNGTAMFVNLQTNAYTNVGITAPAGTSLKGNSAEWIVERPTIGQPGTFGTLADFGMIGMTSEIAYTQSGLPSNILDLPGSPGTGQAGVTLTMMNSAGTTLASPMPQGSSAQFVFVEGPTQ
jgi:hypothetical protein